MPVRGWVCPLAARMSLSPHSPIATVLTKHVWTASVSFGSTSTRYRCCTRWGACHGLDSESGSPHVPERAGVSLKPTVGVTDPGNVRSRTVMRRGDEPLNVSEVVNGLTDCDGCRDKGWK